jgi:uncharacterized membrane protein
MSDRLLFIATLLSALGSGLMAGVFFAFSVFVMGALARLPPMQGIAAMQSINIVVINPLFMAVFLGTGALCVVLAAASLFAWNNPGATYLLIGAIVYIAGSIAVTMFFNVPLNDALALVTPDSAEGASLWARYLSNWTAWNHVRMIACLAAATLLILATCYQMRWFGAA